MPKRLVVGMNVVCVLIASLCLAQAAQDELRFEVASIKSSSPNAYRNFILGPELQNGRLKGYNVSPAKMLATAYGVANSRIIGPDWLDKEHFDVLAKAPEGISDKEIKPLLQSLLKDRFKLAVHWEAKEMPVYDLVIAKTGLKMAAYPAKERPIPNYSGSFPMTRGTLTMPQLSDLLAGIVGRPVFDRTGLSDQYNLVLAFAPSSGQSADASAGGPPDLFTALREQLGLRLDPRRDGVQVVVVDHLERSPSEN